MKYNVKMLTCESLFLLKPCTLVLLLFRMPQLEDEQYIARARPAHTQSSY